MMPFTFGATMISRIFLLLILLVSSYVTSAQEVATARALQVSGVVLSQDSLDPVAFASIYRTRDMRGVWSDINGFFTLPALDGDTLMFVCIGHKPTSVVVKTYLLETSLHLVQVMKIDTVNLATVYVLPRPSREQFRHEFLAMQVQTLNTPEALTAENLYDGLHEMTPDGSENFKRAVVDYQNRELYRGYQPNNLLNPIAWAKFIQMLSRGELNPE